MEDFRTQLNNLEVDVKVLRREVARLQVLYGGNIKNCPRCGRIIGKGKCQCQS